MIYNTIGTNGAILNPYINNNYRKTSNDKIFSTSAMNSDNKNKQGLSTGTKVALGVGFLTAIAIGCDYYFCKGKHVKDIINKGKNLFNKPQQKVSAQTTQNITHTGTKLETSLPSAISTEKTVTSNLEKAKTTLTKTITPATTEKTVNEVKNLSNVTELKYKAEADKIIKEIDEKSFDEIRKLLDKTETLTYDKEIIRHATSAESAEQIRTKGYDIFHRTANNGSNNFGGMDVEALSIADLGKRYGNTKLEYEFSGKAVKLTNKMSQQLDELITHGIQTKDGNSIFSKLLNLSMERPDLTMPDLSKAINRGILRKLGYDAIAVAPMDKTFFLTILDPNYTQGLKFIRTINL